MKKTQLSKWCDRLVLALSFAIVLYQAVYLIAPLRQVMERTNLTLLSQAMAVFGAGLFVADLFLDRTFLKARFVWCLVAVLGIMCVATLIWARYELISNAKAVIWQTVQLLVLFPAGKRLALSNWEKYLKRLFWAISAFYIPAVAVSLVQFVTLDPLYTLDYEYAKIGFVEGRLFGTFFVLYFATLMCLLLLIGAVYYAVKAKGMAKKTLYGIMAAFYALYVILSDSRGIFLGGLAAVLVCGTILGKDRFVGKSKGKGWLCGLLIGLLAGACFCGIYLGVNTGLKTVVISVHGSERMPAVEVDGEQKEEDQMDLDRQDADISNISNNRFDIWKDYAQITCSDVRSFLFGLSPGAYMTILRDRYPDRYVVRYIRENHPDAYEAGSVYDVHNAYLGAFVMTGMLGFLAVVVFLALCAKRVLQHILVQRQRSYGQLALFALVIVILVSAFFDNDLFFWCTNSSVTFWLLAGILLETTEMPAEKGN